MLEFLPSLGQREALAFGDGVALPVRIKFDELPGNCLPRSTTARFTEHWQRSVGDEGFLEQVVERWRTSDIGAGGDIPHAAFLAEGFGPDAPLPPEPEPPQPRRADMAAPRREPDLGRPQPPAPSGYGSPRAPQIQRPSAGQLPHAVGVDPLVEDNNEPGSALRSLRDRLIQRQQR